MWTDDLTTLGYSISGEAPQRALQRFQRHAKRVYRKTAAGVIVTETPVYEGREDGVIDQASQNEIARWIAKDFRLPLGYFKLAPVVSPEKITWGHLREDVAAAWLDLMEHIRSLGGTIDGPYGDTKRPLMTAISIGASKYSFHICGRAVDLHQGLGNSRYFVVQEPQGSQLFWRIYCKTADQSGARGRKFEGVLAYNFVTHTTFPLPSGYYLDLTAEIERNGRFARIHAQNGWQQHTQQSEWWHFQWVPDKQKTFQDEAELIGITETQLRAAGYSTADLDHLPG